MAVDSVFTRRRAYLGLPACFPTVYDLTTMKRLFNFPNKSRKQGASIDTTGSRTSISFGSTTTANDLNNNTGGVTVSGPLGGMGGGMSPTISKRPTGRDGAGPWKCLQVLATEDALLVRPKPAGDFSDLTTTYLKVAWSKVVNVSEVKTSGVNRPSSEGNKELDWESSLDVYGIVGTMTLFSCMW